MAKPVIRIDSATTASVKSAELSAAVIVGNEVTRAKLEKHLGRKVELGELVDLGRQSYYHKNPIKRWWGTLKIRKHGLSQ